MEKTETSSSPARPVFKIDKTKCFQTHRSRRISWGKDQDARLAAVVEANHGRNWKKISLEMRTTFNDPNMTPKKCRERWCNCTNPELNNDSLTETEEIFLLAYHQSYRSKWALISQNMTNRNSSKLKNNFSSLIRKVCRKIALEEKEALVNVSYYIESLYSATIVYELVEARDNPGDIAPAHIYEHVKKRHVTREMCKDYILSLTKSLVYSYQSRSMLMKLSAMVHIEEIKSFIARVMQTIRDRLNPSLLVSDESLLGVIESVLADRAIAAEITAMQMPLVPAQKRQLPRYESGTPVRDVHSPESNSDEPSPQPPDLAAYALARNDRVRSSSHFLSIVQQQTVIRMEGLPQMMRPSFMIPAMAFTSMSARRSASGDFAGI